MSYCPKCGNKIEEEMSFCPRCGALLKTEKAATVTTEAPPAPYRREEKTEEKSEKHEKREKQEKHEKHEKGEYGFIGPLVGGVILLLIGFGFYLSATKYAHPEVLWALLFVMVGLLIIAGGIYGVILAGRRHPRT